MSVTPVKCMGQFQIAARRRVHLNTIVMGFDRHAVQMGQGAALGFAGIAEQTAGRSNFQRRRIAEAGQIMGAKLFAQQALRCVRIKLPHRPCPGTATFAQRFRQGGSFVIQQLRRLPALDQGQQGFAIIHPGDS